MTSRILHRILWARGVRAFANGYVSLLLPLYLYSLGMSAFRVGIIATATLLGSGVLTLAVGFHSHRFEHRALLLMAAILMCATGLGFALVTDFWPLLLIAVVGTLNPSSGDVSVFLPLEHAVLSDGVADRNRTAAFARYSLVGAWAAAIGALFAGVPDLAVKATGLDMRTVLQAMFLLYGLLGLASASIYYKLPRAVDTEARPPAAPLRRSKKIVYTLAALFGLDAFGGGFVVQSMLALWLFQRFHLAAAAAGTIFFWTGALAALSYPLAVRISRRIGLVKTMVFTHLPSNVFLVLVPLMPTLGAAVALLLARSALSQMDVPTRSSYVMAVVPPPERAAAASVTSVPRSLASAAGPVFAGYLLSLSTFGWPLVVAGSLKAIYDLLLLAMFRTIRPPEETEPDRSRDTTSVNR
jgi:MFS family permease